jgi:hypothetical protein
MERAGMVQALEKIQRLLEQGGVLLDLHPTNEPAAIAVRLRQQIIPAGWVNETNDYAEYEWADEALQRVVNAGQFKRERYGTFNFIWHADTMKDLRAYLAEEWQDAIIDDVTALRIEQLLQLPVMDKEILISEAIGIARYRCT